MKHLSRWIWVLSVSTILALASSSRAQWGHDEYDRIGQAYFQFDIGASLPQDFNLTSFDGIPLARPESSADPGVRFDFAGGWEFSPGFAVELDTGMLWNSVDKVGGEELDPTELDLYQTPLMVNLLASIPIRAPWRAYVGGGAGGVFTTADWDLPQFGELSDTDAAFGYQGIAGVKYDINDYMDLGIGYKFMGTSEHSWNDRGVSWTANALLTHSVLVTFTTRF